MEPRETKIENFLKEFEKLYKTGSLHHPEDTYYIKQTFGYASLAQLNKHYPKHDAILIKVHKNNLDVLTPTGHIPIGNLNSKYKGLETFDKKGPIDIRKHNERREVRLQKLREIA